MLEMSTMLGAVIIAGVTLAFNVSLHFFGGGWRLSGRLTSIEASMENVKEELRKLADVLIRLADMRGELRVLDNRMVAAEKDIRELRHGDGFVRGQRGIDREYNP